MNQQVKARTSATAQDRASGRKFCSNHIHSESVRHGFPPRPQIQLAKTKADGSLEGPLGLRVFHAHCPLNKCPCLHVRWSGRWQRGLGVVKNRLHAALHPSPFE